MTIHYARQARSRFATAKNFGNDLRRIALTLASLVAIWSMCLMGVLSDNQPTSQATA